MTISTYGRDNMKRIMGFLKDIHRKFDTEFEIPPFITISLLFIYTIIGGAFGHLLGIDLFAEGAHPMHLVIESLMLRVPILIMYIMFNLLFLYIMIRWYSQSSVSVPVLLSYYAIFTTAVFLVTFILFFIVIVINFWFDVTGMAIFVIFGITLVIIFTLLNLYPGYLFYLAIRDRPLDLFWPLILYIAGIHVISFALFRLWSSVNILGMWGITHIHF